MTKALVGVFDNPMLWVAVVVTVGLVCGAIVGLNRVSPDDCSKTCASTYVLSCTSRAITCAPKVEVK